MRERMKPANSQLFQIILIISGCTFLGCVSKGSTLLCGNFQSYQTVADVQTELNRRGLSSGWSEESRGTSPTDQRTPYRFIYLSGPFKLSGIDGSIKFTFYNGRLMETQFSPQKGDDFMKVLRRESS